MDTSAPLVGVLLFVWGLFYEKDQPRWEPPSWLRYSVLGAVGVMAWLLLLALWEWLKDRVRSWEVRPLQ